MFEQASRNKLRFVTDIGELSCEDVWDLPLLGRDVCLGNLARELSRRIKAISEEESFVERVRDEDKETLLRFDIIKHIIKVKLEEIEKADNEEAKKAQKQQILAVIADKQRAELLEKSVDELKKMLV